jgi:phosphoribosyl 1,2-cyclic phosphodiesterase
MDHAKSVKDLLKLNIEVLSSGATFDALGLTEMVGNKKNIRTGDSSQMFRMGEFKIRPFEVQHDAPESFGFMIRSEELKQNIVFATDTFYLKYNFVNVHCYMIEANYSKEILEENIISGQIHRSLAERTTQSHFEIGDVIEFLKATDTTSTKKVILLHPSSANADPNDFEKRINNATGIDTVTARFGLRIEF